MLNMQNIYADYHIEAEYCVFWWDSSNQNPREHAMIKSA